jgi:Flp pilus assembly pilin Flp
MRYLDQNKIDLQLNQKRPATKPQPKGHGTLNNQRGQGLVEYLIIVSLMGVASIVVVRVMSQSLNSKFTSVAAALQGQSKKHSVEINDSLYKKKDLGNFMNGVGGDRGDSQGE